MSRFPGVKRQYSRLLCAGLVAFFALQGSMAVADQTSKGSLPPSVEALARSIVTIRAYYDNGAQEAQQFAFPFGPPGCFLTARWLFRMREGVPRTFSRFDGKGMVAEELVAEAKGMDLALLKLTGAPRDIEPFPCASHPPRTGETVYILAGCNDHGALFATAKVKAVRAVRGVGTLYLLDGKVNPDFKGSPVLDATGMLYGMFDRLGLPLQQVDLSDQSFIAPVAFIQKHLKKRNIAYATWKREILGQWHLLSAEFAPFRKDGNADKSFQTAIEDDPTSIDAYSAYADFLRRQGRIDQAIAVMKKGVQKNTSDPEFRNGLGWLFSRIGRTDEALRCYKEALALDPHYEQARLNSALLLLRKGKLDEAGRLFSEAIKQNPDSAKGFMGLAGICARRKDQAGVMKYLKRAVEADPRDPVALTAMGVAELHANNPERALAWAGKAQACSEGFYPDAYLLEAHACSALGKSGRAESAYLKLLQILPNEKKLISELGSLYARNHQWAKAEAQARKLKTLDPAMAKVLEAEIAREKGSH